MDDDGCSLKHSGSVAEATHATLTESEYSLFSEGDDTEKSSQEDDGHDDGNDHDKEDAGDDGFDDSLSSSDETVPAASKTAAAAAATSERERTIAPPTKIPSSLHIPSCLHQDKIAQEEETHITEASQEPGPPTSPIAGAAQFMGATTFRRRSEFAVRYRPSDRSIDVALSPTKPSLRRHSSYGKDSTIHLDFSKRGSARVLPKPDLNLLEKRRSDASTQAITTKANKVVFDKIQIREHRITMGDNPSCTYGTPISLDWDYIEFEDLTLDEYEMHKFSTGRGRPRSLRQLYLNHYQRKNRLQLEGFSLEEIKDCKRETNRARKQRDMTRFLAQAKVMVVLEDLVESAGRKVSRVMLKNQKKGEQEKQLLLKIMNGDDTIDTAKIGHHSHNNSKPMSVRVMQG
jgi:hypothetical protein